MPIIDVQQVTKRFGSLKAVDGISFSVEKGRIFGLLGPNGAGKTTAIRMINYIIAPDEGIITIMDRPVGSETQQYIGYLPEERGLYRKMKVGEQLLYLAQLKGLSTARAEEAIRYWLGRFGALNWARKEIHELSKGMQQKIQFVATIAHDPEIYIFDEPFSGLDPINSELLKKVIIELRDRGKTILFATHRMEQVEQMCDDICLFNNGKAILHGNLSGIKRSFGRNTVILEFEGNGAFIDELENVRINNRSTNYAEIRLLGDTNEQVILNEAIQHVNLLRFEFVQPSLHEIFISTVGEDNNKNQLIKTSG